MSKSTHFPLARLRRGAGLALLALACCFLGGQALAQAQYPGRPITLVVPFPPGGGSDTVARAIAPKLGEILGEAIIVDNRPGAGTAIAASSVARAQPDGYTLFLASNSTLTLIPAVRADLPYDSVKSFDPIGMVTRGSLVLLTNPRIPQSSLAGIRAALQAAPGKYAYASFGAGTSSHFGAELAFQEMGVKVLHVPYKGSAPAMNDLVSGQVSFAVDTVTAAQPQLRAGRVKAVAILSPRRSPILPDVPTFVESGFPNVKLETWAAVLAPHGLKASVRAKLEEALAATLADPGVRKALAQYGYETNTLASAATARQIETELAEMRQLAKRANISTE